MIKKEKLNESIEELKFSFDPSNKDWYVDDERVDSITDSLEDLQIDADDLLDNLDRQIDKLEEELDKEQSHLEEVEKAEPEVDWEDLDAKDDDWQAWNDEFLTAREKVYEIASKIDALENIEVYLREISSSIDNLLD